MHRAYEGGSQLHHGKAVLEYLNLNILSPIRDSPYRVYPLQVKNTVLDFGLKLFCIIFRISMELHFISENHYSGDS